MNTKGSIIALAWPETKVIHEGKWYDVPMRWIGVLKDDYYTAGHAAMVILNHDTTEFKYYDFGRYHTPAKKGRVRSYDTDPELKLNTQAIIINGEITNIQELLFELQSKKECHGDGKLLASVYHHINLEKAYEKAEKMQDRGSICYGPFVVNGTNCSRFVTQVTKCATKNWFKKIQLTLPYTVSPSPKFNIRMINSEPHYYIMLKDNQQTVPNQIFSTQSVW